MANESDSPIGRGSVEVAPGVVLARSAVRYAYVRSAGPGGQNVNKLSTKVRVSVSLMALEEAIGVAAFRRLVDLAGPSRVTAAGNLVLVADESRSQRANRQACQDRLRQMIVAARKRPRKRKPTRPTAGSRLRRLDSKRRQSQIKHGRQAPSSED